MRKTHDFAPGVITDPLEAVRRAVYDHKALEASALAIGITHQTLSKKLNPDEPAQLSLLQAAAIEQFLDSDALAECFAARRRGLFVKLPPPSLTADASLVKAYAELVREFSEATRSFSEMLADGRVDAAEVERFRKELRDIYTSGEELAQVATARIGAKSER